ncbi:hypothetical protein [Solemya velum gill symbiont]|nr:hypothetical protein [Solemya velum gill symbiont]
MKTIIFSTLAAALMFQPVLVFADDASIARGGKLYDKWFKVI